jgi:hypothetical protein
MVLREGLSAQPPATIPNSECTANAEAICVSTGRSKPPAPTARPIAPFRSTSWFAVINPIKKGSILPGQPIRGLSPPRSEGRGYAEVLVPPLGLARLIRSNLLRTAGRRLNRGARHRRTDFSERHRPEMVRTKFSRPYAKSLRGPYAHARSRGRWPFWRLVSKVLSSRRIFPDKLSEPGRLSRWRPCDPANRKGPSSKRNMLVEDTQSVGNQGTRPLGEETDPARGDA